MKNLGHIEPVQFGETILTSVEKRLMAGITHSLHRLQGVYFFLFVFGNIPQMTFILGIHHIVNDVGAKIGDIQD